MERIATYVIVILLIILFHGLQEITGSREFEGLKLSTLMLLVAVLGVKLTLQPFLSMITGEKYSSKDMQPAVLIMLILSAIPLFLIFALLWNMPELSSFINWLYRLFIAVYLTIVIIALYKYG